jgi:hypothetical protein
VGQLNQTSGTKVGPEDSDKRDDLIAREGSVRSCGSVM